MGHPLDGLAERFAARMRPARADLAAEHLRGRVAAERFAAGEVRTVTASLLDLTLAPEPGAGLATQLLRGERFTVYETRADGLAWGQAGSDLYVGYVDAAGLGPVEPAGRRVTALASHVYVRPELKARAVAELPFLASVPAADGDVGFLPLAGGGFVPARHLAPVAGDAVAQAERFLGVPYLWGGRSARGIDCSALMQLALMATGVAAPRDSDMLALIGEAVATDAPRRRGDLYFWKGHVAMLRDPDTLLHATAFAMAVIAEPLAPALARIEAADGPITAIRRLG